MSPNRFQNPPTKEIPFLLPAASSYSPDRDRKHSHIPSMARGHKQTQLFAPATPPIFLRIAGNPLFKSETLLGYEVGYRTLLTSRFFVDLSLFYNDYNDLTSFGALVFSSETSPPPPRVVATTTFMNGIKGST
jgi:outer membrane receptor protein involved in Fe transport